MSVVTKIGDGHHTSAVEACGLLFLGGVAASDLSLPIEGQTRQALAEIDAVLAQTGSSKASIVQARVNLRDFADKDAMDIVWREWLGDVGLPSRSTNGNLVMGDNVLIEVVVIAAKES